MEEKKTVYKFEGLRSFFYAVLVALLFRSFLFEPFHIPSGSMLSTLYEGDYIFVSKFAYGYSGFSLPFSPNILKNRVWATEPERGDVVVFRQPTDTSMNYIKRVIGLPGDVIEVRGGVVILNGQRLSLTRLSDEQFKDDAGNVTSVASYEETLPSGVSYKVLDSTRFGDADEFGPVTVPQDHYFMMGDNRDNSLDSRFDDVVGFVPFENLVGRAEVIAASLKPGQSIFRFWQWGSSFRSGRFWREIY